jgi:sugar-specific transcriptional regulator TrmB
MFYKELFDKFMEMLKKSKFFDKVELKVISAMLELEKEGKTKNTASAIARKCGMNVTNTYKYLYKLADLGIVEYEDSKYKVFWLSRINPFPRIAGIITKDYLEKKASLAAAGKIYEELVLVTKLQEKPQLRRFDSYENFELKCAYIIDSAQKKICVISDWIPADFFLILDALKRAKERGVELRWLAENMNEENVEFLEKLGFKVRFFDEMIYPFILVSDEKNGIVVENLEKDGIKGFWFVNYQNDFQENFEKWWESAGEIK